MSDPSPVPANTPSTFADGVRLAIGTLSVFPVRPGVVDRRAGGIAMAVAPLVGAAVGAVAGLVLVLSLWLGVTSLPASVLAVATVALLTRGLHLDGLADLADGLGSGRPAERALEIMKRSDIGPFGVVTLIFVLLVQVSALREAADAGVGPIALVAACAAGRLALTWACRTGVPPARPDGLGAMVAGTVRRSVAVVMTALVLVGTAATTYLYRLCALDWWPSNFVSAFLDGHERRYTAAKVTWDLSEEFRGISTHGAFESELGSPGGLGAFLGTWGIALAVLAGLPAAWAVRRRAVRRLGGVTGDVLGAVVEIATAATLLACTVFAS